MLRAEIGVFGERKYLISSKWWQAWTDYVNFNNQIESSPQNP